MAFGHCGGPGLLPGDSSIGNAFLQNPQTVHFPPAFNCPHPLILVDQCLAPYPWPGYGDREGVAFSCRKLWKRFMVKNFAWYLLVPVLYSLPPPSLCSR